MSFSTVNLNSSLFIKLPSVKVSNSHPDLVLLVRISWVWGRAVQQALAFSVSVGRRK